MRLGLLRTISFAAIAAGLLAVTAGSAVASSSLAGPLCTNGCTMSGEVNFTLEEAIAKAPKARSRTSMAVLR